MTDFSMFDQALIECKKVVCSKPTTTSNCTHKDTTQEGDNIQCLDCGEVFNNTVGNDIWKSYSANNVVHIKDLSRCQFRRNDEKNIYSDVENMGFPNNIVNIANKIYMDITRIEKDKEDFKIHRGTSRKALIFACIFSAYKLSNNPKSWEHLIDSFGLNRRAALSGLKYISLRAPKKSPIRTTYILPVHLIDEIMDKFNCTRKHKQEVVDIYNKIQNKSSILNRSRPQSVAAAVVYYWIQSTGKNVSLKEFTERVDLSELTINNKSREIEKILKNI